MTDTITLTDNTPVMTERSENAVEITFDDAFDNAAEAVFRKEQVRLTELMKAKQEKPRPTLLQRWNAWLRSRRLVVLQRQLAAEQERLASLDSAAKRAKLVAQLAYDFELRRIDSWRDAEDASANDEIRKLEAELELLEAEQ